MLLTRHNRMVILNLIVTSEEKLVHYKNRRKGNHGRPSRIFMQKSHVEGISLVPYSRTFLDQKKPPLGFSIEHNWWDSERTKIFCYKIIARLVNTLLVLTRLCLYRLSLVNCQQYSLIVSNRNETYLRMTNVILSKRCENDSP